MNIVFVLVSLVVSLFFVGLGYASWQDYTLVAGSISTATLRAVIYLDGLSLISGEGYEVHEDGESITISFDSENFNGSLTRLYTVKNTGTIPVRVSTSVISNDPELSITNYFSGTVLENNGDTYTGQIAIELLEEEDVQESTVEEGGSEPEEEDIERVNDTEEQNQEKEIKTYSVTIRLEYGMW